jgi:L-ascorbate metabolism protein UlaG (beta-lactamase superfamily)
MTIQVEFIGHACFRLWVDGRPRLMTDPFHHEDLKIPDDGRRYETDIVIVSSLLDESHNNYGLASGSPQVIDALAVAEGKASVTVDGQPVYCVLAGENDDRPDNPKDNACYAFCLDGVWFVHLGDTGYGLTPDEMLPWQGRCDVLMAIVGEKFTLSLDDLDPMIAFLQPKVIFPMHYNLPPVGPLMSPVSKFVERRRSRDPIISVPHHIVPLSLTPVLAGRPNIVVLKHCGWSSPG